MRKAIFFLAVFCFLVPAIKAEEPSGGQVYHVKMATVVPEMGQVAELMQGIKDELKQRTGGRVRLTAYFGGVMGDEPDIIRKIRLGQLQGGIMLTLLGLGQINPAVKVLQLPFLFNSHDEIDHILATMRPFFDRLFQEKDFYLVSWSEVGWGYFFFKSPVDSMEDLGRVKMVSYTGDPLFSEAEKLAGFGNLVPLHFSETLTGLQTGLINGVFSPFVALIGLQWNSQVKYLLNLPFSYSPGGTIVDKKYFDQMPPELREVFFDVFRKREREIGFNLVRKMEREAHEALLQRGVIEVEQEKKEVIAQEMKKRTLPLYEKCIDQYYPSWLLQEVLNRLAQFRGGNR